MEIWAGINLVLFLDNSKVLESRGSCKQHELFKDTIWFTQACDGKVTSWNFQMDRTLDGKGTTAGLQPYHHQRGPWYCSVV